MSKHERDVQGVALYLEFRRPNSTVQVLITPDGLTGVGDGVAAAQFFRRTLSAGVTKRKWRAYHLMHLDGQKEAVLYETKKDAEQVRLDAISRFRNLADYFDSLVKNGYKLVKDTPVYVEVTKDDLVQVRLASMPTKLWSRVKSSRTSLGFPETITDSHSPSV